MRALRPLLIVAIALFFGHAAAAQSEEPLEPVASPSASAGPIGPVPIGEGALEAGTYTTTVFDPNLTFTVGDGWHALFPDDVDEVALEGSGSFLGMTRPATVVKIAVGRVLFRLPAISGTVLATPNVRFQVLGESAGKTGGVVRVGAVAPSSSDRIGWIIVDGGGNSNSEQPRWKTRIEMLQGSLLATPANGRAPSRCRRGARRTCAPAATTSRRCWR